MSENFLAGYALMMLRRKDTILLLKRSSDAHFGANRYSLIGGGVEKKESFRQAVVRELMEEVGIVVTEQDVHFKHVFYREGVTSPLVALIFECTRWQGEPINKEPSKHSEICWFSLHDLPDNMLPAHRGALESMKQNVLYSEQASSE